jgi:hypothetical protein
MSYNIIIFLEFMVKRLAAAAVRARDGIITPKNTGQSLSLGIIFRVFKWKSQPQNYSSIDSDRHRRSCSTIIREPAYTRQRTGC